MESPCLSSDDEEMIAALDKMIGSPKRKLEDVSLPELPEKKVKVSPQTASQIKAFSLSYAESEEEVDESAEEPMHTPPSTSVYQDPASYVKDEHVRWVSSAVIELDDLRDPRRHNQKPPESTLARDQCEMKYLSMLFAHYNLTISRDHTLKDAEQPLFFYCPDTNCWTRCSVVFTQKMEIQAIRRYDHRDHLLQNVAMNLVGFLEKIGNICSVLPSEFRYWDGATFQRLACVPYQEYNEQKKKYLEAVSRHNRDKNSNKKLKNPAPSPRVDSYYVYPFELIPDGKTPPVHWIKNLVKDLFWTKQSKNRWDDMASLFCRAGIYYKVVFKEHLLLYRDAVFDVFNCHMYSLDDIRAKDWKFRSSVKPKKLMSKCSRCVELWARGDVSVNDKEFRDKKRIFCVCEADLKEVIDMTTPIIFNSIYQDQYFPFSSVEWCLDENEFYRLLPKPYKTVFETHISAFSNSLQRQVFKICGMAFGRLHVDFTEFRYDNLEICWMLNGNSGSGKSSLVEAEVAKESTTSTRKAKNLETTSKTNTFNTAMLADNKSFYYQTEIGKASCSLPKEVLLKIIEMSTVSTRSIYKQDVEVKQEWPLVLCGTNNDIFKQDMKSKRQDPGYARRVIEFTMEGKNQQDTDLKKALENTGYITYPLFIWAYFSNLVEMGLIGGSPLKYLTEASFGPLIAHEEREKENKKEESEEEQDDIDPYAYDFPIVKFLKSEYFNYSPNSYYLSYATWIEVFRAKKAAKGKNYALEDLEIASYEDMLVDDEGNMSSFVTDDSRDCRISIGLLLYLYRHWVEKNDIDEPFFNAPRKPNDRKAWRNTLEVNIIRHLVAYSPQIGYNETLKGEKLKKDSSSVKMFETGKTKELFVTGLSLDLKVCFPVIRLYYLNKNH